MVCWKGSEANSLNVFGPTEKFKRNYTIKLLKGIHINYITTKYFTSEPQKYNGISEIYFVTYFLISRMALIILCRF